METLQKVISIIKANKENCLDVAPDTDLVEELGIDSFDTLMIINAVEDEFAIEFDGTDLGHIRTASDIAKILESKYIKPKDSHGI